jgi:hypothetical protein
LLNGLAGNYSYQITRIIWYNELKWKRIIDDQQAVLTMLVVTKTQLYECNFISYMVRCTFRRTFWGLQTVGTKSRKRNVAQTDERREKSDFLARKDLFESREKLEDTTVDLGISHDDANQ